MRLQTHLLIKAGLLCLGLAVTVPVLASDPAEFWLADLHVDTSTQLYRRGIGMDHGRPLEAGLPALRAGGVDLVVEALWIPRPRDAADPWAHAGSLIEVLEQAFEGLPELTLVRSVREAEEASAKGITGAMLALEGGQALRGDGLSDLRALYLRGVRMVGLTWSMKTAHADSSAEASSAPGLTASGRGLLREMNRLGVIVDVSHMSDAATRDVLELSQAPVVASHSNARSLCNQPRNLPDDLLVDIGRRGGVVGVMFHGPFLCVGAGSGLEAVLNHIEHIATVAGRGSVGIGSDYDGIIQAPGDLPDASVLPAVAQGLSQRGWSSDEVAGVMGLNFKRVWRAVELEALSSP